MTMLGVNASQMELISFGKERPAVSGSGESAWGKNRRDEFRVISGR
jgi:peptidoglycan-associated lipoprotein